MLPLFRRRAKSGVSERNGGSLSAQSNNEMPISGKKTKQTKISPAGYLLFVAALVLAVKSIPTNQVNDNIEVRNFPSAEQLLAEGKAIQTQILSHDPPMNFTMLLFPTSIDRFITKKLLQKKITYEKDVSHFVHYVLKGDSQKYWALYVGANVGYHTLHMASLKTCRIISFEPAPDTANLLQASLELNHFFDRVVVIRKGAADAPGQGNMQRYPESPGLTTLASPQLLPKQWNVQALNATESATVSLVPIEQVLTQYGLPEYDSSQLRLLKVDVEGYEVLALRGLNLKRYPFQYLQIEYFPQLLQASGSVRNPIELMELVVLQHGYKCIREWQGRYKDDAPFTDARISIGSTKEELQKWASTVGEHTNVFCKKGI